MLRIYDKAKDIQAIRSQFPSLNYSEIYYLDNAASTQTVDTAIKAVSDYHYNYRSNVHRGHYEASITASTLFEEARENIAKLIEAQSYEIAFTSGTTEGINLIAKSLPSDRTVIITELEHHSNILPWLQSGRTVDNGKLVVVRGTDDGTVSLEDWEDAVKNNPGAFCSFLTQSNLTGLTLPWRDMIRLAKNYDCEVLLDACQSIGHSSISVEKNNIDWLVCSSHKMYGSTGTGIIFKRGGYVDVEFNVGGGTVEWCDFNSYKLHSSPSRIEAGTPNAAGVLSMGAAAKWIQDTTYKKIQECEAEFATMLEEKGLFNIEELELIGKFAPRSIYSFKAKNVHPSDLSELIGMNNVCVRSGHCCVIPASLRYIPNEQGVFRVSIAPYNDENDCVNLVESIWKAVEKLNSKIS